MLATYQASQMTALPSKGSVLLFHAPDMVYSSTQGFSKSAEAKLAKEKALTLKSDRLKSKGQLCLHELCDLGQWSNLSVPQVVSSAKLRKQIPFARQNCPKQQRREQTYTYMRVHVMESHLILALPFSSREKRHE